MEYKNYINISGWESKVIMILILNVFVFSSEAKLSDFKFRARETYQFHRTDYRGQKLDFQGLSNTINFWYENPFNISFGLAGGAILGSSKTNERPANGLNQKLNFYFLGLETKYFFTKSIKGLFARLGLYWDTVDTNSSIGKINGWSYYTGLGWEFHIADSMTLAPEFGLKQGDTQGLLFTTFAISIGLHFY